jgi:hypothetical protein
MKYLSFFLLLPFLSFGQIEVYYQENLVQSYDTIIYISTDKPIATTVFGEAIQVKNASNSDQHIKVYREELEMVEGSESQICWGSYCYSAAVTSSIESLVVSPDSFEETFKAYYLPNESYGQSDIKFTFLDTLTGDETVIITRFQVLDLSIPVFKIEDVSVYPNPFNDAFFIEELPPDASYTITDYSGQVVFSGTSSQLNLSFLRKGMYILNINNVRSIKLMKE